MPTSKAAAELQALHLSGFTRLQRPKLERLPRAATGMPPPQRRPVYFGAAGGAVEAQVFERTALAPGFKQSGPALIEEYGSTTLVWPGDSFEIGSAGRNPHSLWAGSSRCKTSRNNRPCRPPPSIRSRWR